MSDFIVHPVKSLHGVFQPSGAKNAALPILIACILTDGPVCLKNVPDITDISGIVAILKYLGGSVLQEKDVLHIDCSNISMTNIPLHLTQGTRISVLLLGAMVARFSSVQIGFPGGCPIGENRFRPIDFHRSAFQKMGITWSQNDESVYLDRKGSVQASCITLAYPSVTATENVMLAALFGDGTTTIENAACEPEVLALADFLNACGAKIRGAGQSLLSIEGVKKLRGTHYKIIPDRIETGTFLAMVACTGGELEVQNCVPKHLLSAINLLKAMQVDVSVSADKIYLKSNPLHLKACSFVAQPYPLLATDLQAQFLVLNLVANGEAVVEDAVFPKRFQHVHELNKMGAGVRTHDNAYHIPKSCVLHGASIRASDLRASASLVMAGLVAHEGSTCVQDIYHLERGYHQFCEKVRALGGVIERK